jgi:hypothetical protein
VAHRGYVQRVYFPTEAVIRRDRDKTMTLLESESATWRRHRQSGIA